MTGMEWDAGEGKRGEEREAYDGMLYEVEMVSFGVEQMDVCLEGQQINLRRAVRLSAVPLSVSTCQLSEPNGEQLPSAQWKLNVHVQRSIGFLKPTSYQYPDGYVNLDIEPGRIGLCNHLNDKKKLHSHLLLAVFVPF